MNNMFSAKSNEHLSTWVYIGSPGRVNSIAAFGSERGDARCLKRRTGRAECRANIAQEPSPSCAKACVHWECLMDWWCFFKKEAIHESKRAFSLAT